MNIINLLFLVLVHNIVSGRKNRNIFRAESNFYYVKLLRVTREKKQ